MERIGLEVDGDNLKWSAAWTWMLSEAGTLALEEAASIGEHWDPTKFMRWLRTKYDPQQSALIVEQLRLRDRAKRKFSKPDLWVWTQKLLEQSSDEKTAAHTATFFPADACIIDLCCGAGSDSVALAQSHQVLFANDVDDLACCLAERNFRSHQLSISVVRGAAEDLALPRDAWIHIDPDRRSLANRTTRLESFAPPREFLEKLRRDHPGGSIKLAPGSTVPQFWSEEFGLHWIALDASVRQLRAWWGSEAFEAKTRSVSVGKTTGDWKTYRLSEQEIAAAEQEVAITASCAEWIGDTDPAFRISGLLVGLARDAGAKLLADRDGYLVASTPRREEFIRWFRVEDIVPLDEKQLRKHLRERNVGTLEIKQRNAKIDIERLRNALKLSGDESRTLFVTKFGSVYRAIIARNC